jgi:cobalt transporter subunit CbtA
MLGRLILAAAVAGIAGGLVFGALQQVLLTPMITAAEQFEHTSSVSALGAVLAHASAGSSASRTLFTYLTSIVTGTGFAALLVGLSTFLGLPQNRKTLTILGLCGFMSVSLAPAVGLPPSLPGMPDAPVDTRQIWWTATVIATAVGLWLLLVRKDKYAWIPAVLIMAAPHLIGAPLPPEVQSDVPAHLAARFVGTSLACSLIFWCVIGYLLARALELSGGEQFGTHK